MSEYRTKYFQLLKSLNASGNSGSYAINMKKAGYTGNTAFQIDRLMMNGAILSYVNNDDKNTDASKAPIIGSSFDYSFWVKTGDTSINRYDELLEINYKDYQLAIENYYQTGKTLYDKPATGYTAGQSSMGAVWKNSGGHAIVTVSGLTRTVTINEQLHTTAPGGSYYFTWASQPPINDTLSDGNTNTYTVQTNSGGNISTIVQKASNSGNAEGPVSIVYSIDGHTVKNQNYSIGQAVNSIYIFQSGSSLSIVLNETIPNNTISGSCTIHGNGSNVGTVSLGGSTVASYSLNPIPIGSSSNSTGTPNSTFGANVTMLAITLFASHVLTTTSNSLALYDNTSATNYNGSVSGSGTNNIVITFSLPAVAGHHFTLSGTYVFSGG